jgi:hypothetical protein
MYELVPCPNQKCRGGRIHYRVGCDIWNECPTCNGSGSSNEELSSVRTIPKEWRDIQYRDMDDSLSCYRQAA